MTDEQILSGPEWEALLFGVKDSLRPLVVRLALAHNYLKPSEPESCPVCGKGRSTGEQMRLEAGQ